MPSLDQLLFNSSATAAPQWLPAQSAGQAGTATYTFGGGQSANSQSSSFDDALRAARQSPPVTTDATPADDVKRDQRLLQESRTAEQSRQERRAQREKSARADQQSTSASDNQTDTQSRDSATAATTPSTGDSANPGGGSTAPAKPDQGNDTSPAKSAGEQTVTASSQTAATPVAPPVPQEPAASELPAGGKSGPKTVSQETPAGGEKLSLDKPASAAAAPPKETLPDAADPQEGDPDSLDDGKGKPGVPANQAVGKQAVKVGQADDSQDGAPAPQQPPAASPQMVEQLITQAAHDVASSGAARPPSLEDKPPVPSPTVLTATTSTSPANAGESAEAAAPAQQLPATTADQTFEQVVMGLRGRLDPQNGKAEIQLNPPNLGTLHVSVSLTNGSLTAEFQSSSDVVRDLLRSNIDKLKSVLEGQGVAVDKLAVESPRPSPDQASPQSAKAPPTGSPNHDGRSAGQYSRDPQSGQKQSSGAFARLWQDARGPMQDAPIDLVA